VKTTREARTPRFHVAAELTVGAELTLPKEASRHFLGVLRGAVGDALCLFNGDGRDYGAELVESGRTARVRVVAARDNTTESRLVTTLVQGVSRADRMDATVRQAVELGVTRIVPARSRRTTVKLDDARAAKRHAHWRGIVVSACEQSGRARVPVLEPLVDLEDWLAGRPADRREDRREDRHAERLADASTGFDRRATTGLVLVPGAARSLGEVPLEHGADVTVVIGPESGLDPVETDAALAAGLHAAHLGPRILRTETAGPATLALLQARHGDL